ncbi:MAG: ABC transporter ATP-binding protein [Flavobacteriales bacterium]|nr:ABC transporter ATP-binding protein [Flavobacteriales bacterium]MCB9365260.1 ABC transporter ATP-binding protein [Flavobacteriales bacterium]
MIKINSLNKSYGSKQILSNINLSFNEGEINGIVGENGAGKTTLFKCLASLEQYDGDIIYENGILKNVTGFLTTDPYILSKITGKEYLQLFCNARNVVIDNFDEINIFDLPLNQYADTYSTGMKKKLALTAILLQKNEVFILDEPFNGVDIQSNIVIKEVLLKLKELKKTVIISSHIFSTLNETCDYLHHLKNGRIIKSVAKNDFKSIEDDMKLTSVSYQIDKLNLI